MDRQDVKPPFAYYETRATNYRVEMLDDDALELANAGEPS